jgi:hypothetical protein
MPISNHKVAKSNPKITTHQITKMHHAVTMVMMAMSAQVMPSH